MSTTTSNSPATLSARQRRVALRVPTMGSDHCAGLVATSLRRVEGVEDLTASIVDHRVEVGFSHRVQPAAGCDRDGCCVSMTASSLSVVGNSLRLRRVSPAD
jgi:cation transport ATPase